MNLPAGPRHGVALCCLAAHAAVLAALALQPRAGREGESLVVPVTLTFSSEQRLPQEPLPLPLAPAARYFAPPMPPVLIASSAAAPAAVPAAAADPAPASPSRAIAEAALPATAGTTPPEPVQSGRPDYAYNPPPAYPQALREQGLGGTVWLRVWVDPAGRPREIQVSRSSGLRLFDEAALHAVTHWRFVPARRGSQLVASWVEFPVRFTLS